MKTAYLYIIMFFTTQFQAQEIALMTYNIRLDVISDGLYDNIVVQNGVCQVFKSY